MNKSRKKMEEKKKIRRRQLTRRKSTLGWMARVADRVGAATMYKSNLSNLKTPKNG
jgi:hypothetical protein